MSHVSRIFNDFILSCLLTWKYHSVRVCREIYVGWLLTNPQYTHWQNVSKFYNIPITLIYTWYEFCNRGDIHMSSYELYEWYIIALSGTRKWLWIKVCLSVRLTSMHMNYCIQTETLWWNLAYRHVLVQALFVERHWKWFGSEHFSAHFPHTKPYLKKSLYMTK